MLAKNTNYSNFEVFNYEKEPDVISTSCLSLGNETKQRSGIVIGIRLKTIFGNPESGG